MKFQFKSETDLLMHYFPKLKTKPLINMEDVPFNTYSNYSVLANIANERIVT